MRFSSLGLLAGLAASVVAEDLLFIDSLQDKEYDEAIALGYTAKVVTEDEWRAMTTADFAAFKAIVIPDPNCGDISEIKFLEDTKAVWSPAVLGNIILIGTDPTYHFSTGGAQTLIDNSIKFVASGKTPGGVDQTGLYFALSCYYNDVDSSTVDALSVFGDFTVRGNLNCYDKAHLVAHSDAMTSLDDAAISDWSCSVHEAFSSYPSVGVNGFQALAIAQDIIGDGSQTFGDGTIGLPYIISRGATPAKCGDGVWDEAFGEECDDNNTVNGDGCSASCKCESGLPKGDGTCLPAPGGNTSTPISTPISTPVSSSSASGYPTTYGGYYGNHTETVTPPPYPYPSTTVKPFYPPPYVTPKCPTGPKIVGVEIIVEVTITESCKTIDSTSTVTEIVTVPCATKERPIYDVETSGLPCYVCAMSSEGVSCPTSHFLTVSTTACPSCSGGHLPTYAPPVVYTSSSCSGYTLTKTDIITPGASAYTYPAIPYPTIKPHEHQETTTAPGATDYATYSAYGVPSGTGLATYKATGTGSATPYKPTSSIVPFTGGANGNVVTFSALIGGAVLALAAML